MAIKIVKQRKVLESALEPTDKNWLWLHTKDGERVLEEFINGKWTVVSGTSKALEDAVTRTELDRSISAARTSITDALKDYVDQHSGGGGTTPPEVTKKDLNDLINTVNRSIDTLATNIDELLAGKQDTLSAGRGINISSSNEISCTIPSGGGGDGTSIAIVEEGTETDDDTFYFFSKSPSQGVGLYNILLRDSVYGEDVYSPGILYHLDDEVNYSVVNRSDNISFDDNKVYCCGKLTAMKRYGEVTLSSLVKYSDTLSTALLVLKVAGPFFEDETDVTVAWNDNTVAVEILGENNIWTRLHSGSSLKFTYNDFCEARKLRIIRLDVPDTSNSAVSISKKLVNVTFNNGVENTVCRVIFSSGTLFFKSASNPIEYADGTNTYPTEYVPNADAVFINERDYNVFYALMTKANPDNLNCQVYHDAWIWDSGSPGDKKICYSTAYDPANSSARTRISADISEWGLAPLFCTINDNDVFRYGSKTWGSTLTDANKHVYRLQLKHRYATTVTEYGLMQFDPNDIC